MRPGNAGGGKGPQFKTDAIRGEGHGDWATSSGFANTGPFSMSVARRFEFVIGPFWIIDLAKISAFPICRSVLLLARPILTLVLSPEDQCSEPSCQQQRKAPISVGVSFLWFWPLSIPLAAFAFCSGFRD